MYRHPYIDVQVLRRQARMICLFLLFVFTVSFAVAAFAQPGEPMVIVGQAEQRLLVEEVPLSGSVVSRRIAGLSTEVSGIVQTVGVEIGDRVAAGDEILRLDARLESLSLDAARAVTNQAQQALDDARRRLADAEALAKRQTVSANELKSLAAEVRIDAAALQRYQAEEARQQARIQRHRLVAPFTGLISKRLVEQGEWVQPGEPVVELVAMTDLQVDFRVPQSVYAKLDQAGVVAVRLDALPAQSFKGRVASVIPVTDPMTRTFLMRVMLDEPPPALAPGMSASATLRLTSGAEGVAVQRDALMRYPDGRITVWVVNGDGDSRTVSEQQVETGLSFDGKVNITRGLSAGTMVVLQGNEALRDGQRVMIRRTE